MKPGDRVRHRHEAGHIEVGRLLAFKSETLWTRGVPRLRSFALVQFRGRRRTYCHIHRLEVVE